MMKEEYDFSSATRGALVHAPAGKTRITIRIDDDILECFREKVDASGGGSYQTMINDALRRYIEHGDLKTALVQEVRETIENVMGYGKGKANTAGAILTRKEASGPSTSGVAGAGIQKKAVARTSTMRKRHPK